MTVSSRRASAFIALLVVCSSCSRWRDPRQVLVQLNVPYTTDSWLAQSGAGDTVAVTAFLAAGMDPNTRDEDGHTALMNAAAGGHDALVRLLLAKGAKVNVTGARGMTPLAAAILNDRPGVIAQLLDAGGELTAPTVDRHPLMLAIRAHRPKAVRQLLDGGAHAYIQDDRWSALMMAAFIGEADMVDALLASDANLNAANDEGVTAVMYAASAGHTAVVRTLIGKGARIDTGDAAGMTALMLAANNGHPDTAQALLDAGANAAARSRTGATAASLAAANGHSTTGLTLPVASGSSGPRGQDRAAQKPTLPLEQAEEIDQHSAAEWDGRERQYFVSSDDPRLFDNAAHHAWAYVARYYEPATGFVSPTSSYAYTTVWDVASGIAALYCGHALKFVDDGEYDRRLRRVLATLRTMGIVDNAAFNKVYATHTAAMLGRNQQPSTRGYGWSTTDIGRLLVWLKIVALAQPAYAADAAAIVKRLDFARLVTDGYMWGQDFDAAWKPRRYQEGQIGYEQYAASGFALWGAHVERALRLEENGLPVAVMGRTLYADARGRDRLTSDPFILMGLEIGWDPAMARLSRGLLDVQEERYRRTGRVTVLSEDSISRPPHFFYYYSAYTHRKAFGVDVQAGGTFVDEPRWVSAKAAFAWHALLPRHYTRLAVQTVQPAQSAAGWESGVFEGTSTSTGSLNINTAAVILTAALVDARRGQPLIHPVRDAR